MLIMRIALVGCALLSGCAGPAIEYSARFGKVGGANNSVASRVQGRYLAKPADIGPGYWYGPAAPTGNWLRIPDVPDYPKTAKTK